MDALYLADCYLKEFDAEVREVAGGKTVVLDRTAFYPTSGGQPHDTGTMRRLSDGKIFRVCDVRKENGAIAHDVDAAGLQKNDHVRCAIDWERRHALMRCHTASHVLDGVVQKATGALVTGNQLAPGKGRVDFALENFDKGMLQEFESRANEILSKNLPVHIQWLSREEVLKRPELIKLAMGIPEHQREMKEFRIIEVEGFDAQPCGGTHVRNTREVGKIKITGAENKGRSNRRVYFALER